MIARQLNGKELAARMQEDISTAVKARIKRKLPSPGLAVILVGDSPASEIYVHNKCLRCQEVGFSVFKHHLDKTVSEYDVIKRIHTLNQDPYVHGILLQLPIPKGLDVHSIIEEIDPKKDVDGLHPSTIGRLLQRKPLLRPCTSYGIIQLLQHTGVDLSGKHAVVVGASNLVGRPMLLELLLKKCTVTVCHQFSSNLPDFTQQQADILIAAVGKPKFIQGNWIKPGAIVIDVGINRLQNEQLVGDVDFEAAQRYASWITPVPGGVGPMTIITLLHNTLLAAHLADQHTELEN